MSTSFTFVSGQGHTSSSQHFSSPGDSVSSGAIHQRTGSDCPKIKTQGIGSRSLLWVSLVNLFIIWLDLVVLCQVPWGFVCFSLNTQIILEDTGFGIGRIISSFFLQKQTGWLGASFLGEGTAEFQSGLERFSDLLWGIWLLASSSAAVTPDRK